MKKFNFNDFSRSLKRGTIKYSPEILMGLGTAGMLTAIVMGIAATPKALELIKEEEDRQNEDAQFEDEVVPISKKDCIRVAWRCYVPTIVTAAMSTACLVGSSRVNYKRNAALAAAYNLSESAFKNYRAKVMETVGPTKEREVRDGLAKDVVEKKFKGSENEIIETGFGDTIFIDELSGQEFRSSVDHIRRAEGRLLKNMVRNDYVSLNDLYYEIGIRQTPLGNDLGWHISDGKVIDLDFGSTVINDKPCMVLQYRVEPRADYDKFS